MKALQIVGHDAHSEELAGAAMVDRLAAIVFEVEHGNAISHEEDDIWMTDWPLLLRRMQETMPPVVDFRTPFGIGMLKALGKALNPEETKPGDHEQFARVVLDEYDLAARYSCNLPPEPARATSPAEVGEEDGARVFLAMLRGLRAVPEIPMTDAVREATGNDSDPGAVMFDYQAADAKVAECLRAVGLSPEGAMARGFVKAFSTFMVAQQCVGDINLDGADDDVVSYLLTVGGFRDDQAARDEAPRSKVAPQ
jgi:hypothetical protein